MDQPTLCHVFQFKTLSEMLIWIQQQGWTGSIDTEGQPVYLAPLGQNSCAVALNPIRAGEPVTLLMQDFNGGKRVDEGIWTGPVLKTYEAPEDFTSTNPISPQVMPWQSHPMEMDENDYVAKASSEEDVDEFEANGWTPRPIAEIEKLRPQLARAAQKPYDEWEQDENGQDEMLGAGGVCDEIVDAMLHVLGRAGWTATSIHYESENHTAVVVLADEGIFVVDIPFSIYEKMLGYYQWKKIPGVTFKPQDITVDKISDDRKDFAQYMEGAVKASGWDEWPADRPYQDHPMNDPYAMTMNPSGQRGPWPARPLLKDQVDLDAQPACAAAQFKTQPQRWNGNVTLKGSVMIDGNVYQMNQTPLEWVREFMSIPEEELAAEIENLETMELPIDFYRIYRPIFQQDLAFTLYDMTRPEDFQDMVLKVLLKRNPIPKSFEFTTLQPARNKKVLVQDFLKRGKLALSSAPSESGIQDTSYPFYHVSDHPKRPTIYKSPPSDRGGSKRADIDPVGLYLFPKNEDVSIEGWGNKKYRWDARLKSGAKILDLDDSDKMQSLLDKAGVSALSVLSHSRDNMSFYKARMQALWDQVLDALEESPAWKKRTRDEMHALSTLKMFEHSPDVYEDEADPILQAFYDWLQENNENRWGALIAHFKPEGPKALTDFLLSQADVLDDRNGQVILWGEPQLIVLNPRVVEWKEEREANKRDDKVYRLAGKASPTFSKLNVQFHTVMIDAPQCSPDMTKDFAATQTLIPIESVYEKHPYQTDFPDGREQKPHTTVLFGLEDDDCLESIREHCLKLPPIKFEIGNVSAFRSEDKPYDVLKVEVFSEDMKNLHYWIRDNFPNQCAFDFNGHITLAYVKKGTCADLEGPCEWTGSQYTCDQLTFSHKDEGHFPIQMGAEQVAAAHKSLARQYFKGKPEKPCIEVYRIEDADGRGPYAAMQEQDLVPFELESGETIMIPDWMDEPTEEHQKNHPTPPEDKGFTESDRRKLRGSGWGNLLFGFRSLAELNSWFSPQELENLKKIGYRVVKRKAQNAWGSGKQVFFEPYKEKTLPLSASLSPQGSTGWKDQLPGGLADKKTPEDFDPSDLKQGIEVEMEHTSDEKLATEIAMDHLTEDPDYYRKLKTVEALPTTSAKVYQPDLEDAFTLINTLLNDEENEDSEKELRDLWEKSLKKAKMKTLPMEWASKNLRVYDHGRRIKDKYLKNPIIVGEVAPGVFEVLDGNHRMISLFEKKAESIDALMIPMRWAEDLEAMESQTLASLPTISKRGQYEELPEGQLKEFYDLCGRDEWEQDMLAEALDDWKGFSEEDKAEQLEWLRQEGYSELDEEVWDKKSAEDKEETLRGYYQSQFLRDAEEDRGFSTETFFSKPEVLKDQRLVRFSMQPPEKFLKEGFSVGHDPENLGLTTLRRPQAGGELQFAFANQDLKTLKEVKEMSGKYGSYGYQFKVKWAVRAFHHTDYEWQTVFSNEDVDRSSVKLVWSNGKKIKD